MAFNRLTTNTTTTGTGYFLIGGQGAQLASADSIAVTSGFHEVTGSTTINTITGGSPGMGVFLYRPTGATWALGSGGNINAGSTTPVERVVMLVTPDGNTWYAQPDSITVASANSDITVAESGGTYTLTFNPGNVTLDEFTGPLAISKGGTGQTTATASFDALAPTTTQGDIIYHNGTDNVRLAKGTAGQALLMNSGATAPEWGSELPVTDSTAIVKGSADATKKLRFEVDGFTTATTRVLTPPNADATIAGLGVAQTFSAAQTFSSTVALNGNVTVGSTGSTIKAIWTGSTTANLGSVSDNAFGTTTITVTGAAAGDIALASMASEYPTNAQALDVSAAVTGANTVTVYVRNNTGASVDPVSATFYVVVFDIT